MKRRQHSVLGLIGLTAILLLLASCRNPIESIEGEWVTEDGHYGLVVSDRDWRYSDISTGKVVGPTLKSGTIRKLSEQQWLLVEGASGPAGTEHRVIPEISDGRKLIRLFGHDFYYVVK